MSDKGGFKVTPKEAAELDQWCADVRDWQLRGVLQNRFTRAAAIAEAIVEVQQVAMDLKKLADTLREAKSTTCKYKIGSRVVHEKPIHTASEVVIYMEDQICQHFKKKLGIDFRDMLNVNEE